MWSCQVCGALVSKPSALDRAPCAECGSDSQEFVRFLAPGGFAVDDELHFSSEFRNKLVYLHNLSSPKHIMDKVVPDSVWPIIFPGANELHFSNSDKFEWLELNYYSAYWGV